MKVGFLSNQIDNRGTGNAMYDYARWNQSLLGNESYIFSFLDGKHHPRMVQQYNARFMKVIFTSPERLRQSTAGMDVLYHIKYGDEDGIRPNPSTTYAVHSVFTNTPHGDRYATVSRWLSSVGPSGGMVPFVPHIIDIPEPVGNLRKQLGIPESGIVFGRYGGYETFDISWVWDVMEKVLSENDNIYFLFANTEPFLEHPRVIYQDELLLPVQKSAFIATCDYMLHARHRGETFGMAVGEFASKGKPIITYANSGEKAHIWELDNYIAYVDQFDLYRIFTDARKWRTDRFGYTQYTPEYVMEEFRKVFLS